MAKNKTVSLNFTQIEINLLIRASEHLKDAYVSDEPAMKATATMLQNLRDKLSEASKELIKGNQ